jgi:uncharacterized membrane protein YphA (DoxX/SURF4 family)
MTRQSDEVMVGFLPVRAIVFFALLALASPFLVSGIIKLTDFAGTVAEVRALTGASTALAPPIAALVILVQLGGAALLLCGRKSGVVSGAAVLAGFTIVATLVAHAWWAKTGLERSRDLVVFFEHLAICGGLMLAAVLAWRR